jgi:hypothetical protein
MSQFTTLENVACCLEKLTAKVANLEGRVKALEDAVVVSDPNIPTPGGNPPPPPPIVHEVTLAGGEAFHADTTVDGETGIQYEVEPAGVPGEISYSIEPGVGIKFMSDSCEDTSTIKFSIY